MRLRRRSDRLFAAAVGRDTHGVRFDAQSPAGQVEVMDAVATDPERYATQFGGYCAFAVSHGSTADAAPTVWTIVDGKLYLNYNQRHWRRDAQTHIERAHRNWPMLHR